MRIPTIVLLLLLASTLDAQDTAAVKSPMDYFNLAAKQYVKEDKMTALRTLDQGLQHHPQDPRLRQLATELMKEQQQQQQQQQKQQDEQNDGSSKSEQGNDGQDPRKQEEGNDQQRTKPPQENRTGDPKQPRPGEIAPQDAKRILDALDRQEQQVQSKMRQKQQPAPKTPVDKDW